MNILEEHLPHERSWQTSPISTLPADYKSLLTQAKRLSHHFEQNGTTIGLRVLKMAEEYPREYEAEALGMPANCLGFIREIMLFDQDHHQALSHGRVCIRGNDETSIALLEKLGDKPLGEALLHHDRTVSRSGFLFRPAFDEDTFYVQTNEHHNSKGSAIWSRYSVFSKEGLTWLVLTETIAR